jgi:hypothetical protein
VDPGSSFSSGCIDFDDYARWVGEIPVGSRVYDLLVRGKTLYLTSSVEGFGIWDITDPFEPVRKGSLPGLSGLLAVEKDRAYVTQDRDLHVIDVSDPGAPRIEGSLSLPDYASDLVARWPSVYLTAWRGGLLVIDVADPGAPEITAILDTDRYAIGLDVDYPYAFVLDTWEGLLVIDVSRPSSPRQVGSCPEVRGEGIAVQGNFAYLRGGDLQVVDVSDPRRPEPMGSEWLSCIGSEPTPQDLLASANRVFVIECSPILHLIDVSNPNDPRSLGTIAAPGSGLPFTSLAREGDVVYLAADSSIAMIDVSSPELPRPASAFAVPPSGARAVALAENLLIIALSGGGLEIRDLSNPLAPKRSVRIGLDKRFVDLAARDSLVCLADPLQGLTFLGIRDPPYDSVLLGEIDTRGSAERLALCEDRAYVAGDSGLIVVDFSHPDEPAVDTVMSFTGTLRAVDVEGKSLCLGGWQAPFSIFDVSEPARPVLVGSLGTVTQITDLDVERGYAYVLDGRLGFLVIDVSLPGDPRVVGRIARLPRRTFTLHADGDLVYLMNLYDTEVVDVSRPSAPRILGSVGVGPEDLVVHESYLYLALHNGVQIFGRPCGR